MKLATCLKKLTCIIPGPAIHMHLKAKKKPKKGQKNYSTTAVMHPTYVHTSTEGAHSVKELGLFSPEKTQGDLMAVVLHPDWSHQGHAVVHQCIYQIQGKIFSPSEQLGIGRGFPEGLCNLRRRSFSRADWVEPWPTWSDLRADPACCRMI